jgi:hypothetical protein
VRRSRSVALPVTAAAVLIAVAAPAFGAHLLDTPGTIKLTDRLVKHIHVRSASKTTHAGALDFYRQQLFNKGITPVPIGHSDLTCIDTGTGSQNCTGTYFLPKGKIMVGGVIASRLFYELAVMGGTGLYDNVNGTLTVTFLGGQPAKEFLLFRLGVGSASSSVPTPTP